MFILGDGLIFQLKKNFLNTISNFQLTSNEYSDPIESSQADSAPDRPPSRQPSHRTRRRRRRQDEPQPPSDTPPITQHRHFCSSRIFKVSWTAVVLILWLSSIDYCVFLKNISHTYDFCDCAQKNGIYSAHSVDISLLGGQQAVPRNNFVT